MVGFIAVFATLTCVVLCLLLWDQRSSFKSMRIDRNDWIKICQANRESAIEAQDERNAAVEQLTAQVVALTDERDLVKRERDTVADECAALQAKADELMVETQRERGTFERLQDAYMERRKEYLAKIEQQEESIKELVSRRQELIDQNERLDLDLMAAREEISRLRTPAKKAGPIKPPGKKCGPVKKGKS